MILCLLCFRVQKRVSRPGREIAARRKNEVLYPHLGLPDECL